ncbi:MAG: uroporphyrinogen-III synthase [Planctomycetia bacterium]
MKRILVTGPVGRLDEWRAAAESAGWSAEALPLVAVEPVGGTVDVEGHDALVATSASVLSSLPDSAARLPRVACVGERVAAWVRARGGAEPIAAADSRLLVDELARAWPSGLRVLHPRGDLAGATSEALRARGFRVSDPVVYRTLVLPPRAAPPGDAVLLASPSAVRAWLRVADARGLVVAIGRTTAAAAREAGLDRGATLHVLDEPTPRAFARLLARIEPRP